MATFLNYRQEPPFAVQVELVEGCNLRCDFCGIQGIRAGAGGPYSYMEMDTAIHLANQMARLKWTARLEFAMHGEPTMHPGIVEIISVFRTALPKNPIMITTNGGGLLGGTVQKLGNLKSAGVNTIAIDDYQYTTIGSRLRSALDKGGVKYLDYPAEKDIANPHKRSRDFRIIFVEDISVAKKGTHSILNNHAGSASPPNHKGAGHRCAKPFRELSVRWDGNVAICCNDWRGELPIGNTNNLRLEHLWNSPIFNAARKFLYHRRREFEPCNKCDAKSYRVGLLPDKRGKLTLPEPTSKDAIVIFTALGMGPLTAPVKRPWEEK